MAKRIIETLPFKVNNARMREDLEQVKRDIPITWQGKEFGHTNFGGWSVLSRLGTCDNGWEIGADNFHDKNGKNYCLTPSGYNWRLAKYFGFSHAFEHKNKTPACIGEINNLIDILDAFGFSPRRARISVLKAGTVGTIHIDASPDKYMCRIHVPIVTNEKCFHWIQGHGDFHMPADGTVYMLPVNNYHQIRNESDEDRYHLIMDAYDTRGFTDSMQYRGNLDGIEYDARMFRSNIENANLTIFHRMLYWAGKEIYKFNKRVV